MKTFLILTNGSRVAKGSLVSSAILLLSSFRHFFCLFCFLMKLHCSGFDFIKFQCFFRTDSSSRALGGPSHLLLFVCLFYGLYWSCVVGLTQTMALQYTISPSAFPLSLPSYFLFSFMPCVCACTYMHTYIRTWFAVSLNNSRTPECERTRVFVQFCLISFNFS